MPREVLFLDRDGLINKMVPSCAEGYDSPLCPEEVKLVEGIENIIAWANKRGIPTIEVTNQPGMAKGKLTLSVLDAIEHKVHQLLSERGVYVDQIYRCLHHPRAFVPEFKVECDCRKPKPGLLIRAAHDFKIDLGNSVFYGDSDSDILAGNEVRCRTILLMHQENTAEKILKARMANASFRVQSHREVVPLLEGIWG